MIYVICTIDLIQSCFGKGIPYIDNFLRPVVVLIILSRSRDNMKGIFFDIKDSAIVVVCILAFVIFFSIAGYFIFRTSFEGYSIFTTPSESFY